jgi:16S rRNA C967 or C1407 C5-methylase (RsmB/RsmF family)
MGRDGRTQVTDGDANDDDYRLPGLPRYVRINTIKIGKKAANKKLLETGHHHCPDPAHPGNRSFYHDETVPDLLVFKPKGRSDISRVPMVESGEVVIQQKASCFPAVALAPPPGATVIDACAAPGNKTSHVSPVPSNPPARPRPCQLELLQHATQECMFSVDVGLDPTGDRWQPS